MKRRVFFHYNKPESKRQSQNVLTVHWKGECIPVNSIVCRVPTETHDRNSQPRCVVRGWAEVVTIEEKDLKKTAVIK